MRGVDLGNGPGKSVTRTIKGGTVGVVLDGRGRPLQLPEDSGERRRAVRDAIVALDLYPDSPIHPPTISREAASKGA